MSSKRPLPNGTLSSSSRLETQAYLCVRLNTKIKSRDVAVSDLVKDLSDGVRCSWCPCRIYANHLIRSSSSISSKSLAMSPSVAMLLSLSYVSNASKTPT